MNKLVEKLKSKIKNIESITLQGKNKDGEFDKIEIRTQVQGGGWNYFKLEKYNGSNISNETISPEFFLLRFEEMIDDFKEAKVKLGTSTFSARNTASGWIITAEQGKKAEVIKVSAGARNAKKIVEKLKTKQEEISSIVFSHKVKGTDFDKVEIKPVVIGGGWKYFQVEKYKGDKFTDDTVAPELFFFSLEDLLENFLEMTAFVKNSKIVAKVTNGEWIISEVGIKAEVKKEDGSVAKGDGAEKFITKLRERSQNLISITLSRKTKTGEFDKIKIRPIGSSGRWSYFQLEKYEGNRVSHDSISPELFFFRLEGLMDDFLEVNVALVDSEILATCGGRGWSFVVKEEAVETKRVVNHDHNKKKDRIIESGDEVPALIDLGVFDENYNLIQDKSNKLTQINNFLAKVDETFKEMSTTNQKAFTIADFGSGKAYLTFLLYYYFKEIKNKKVKIIGYDIKEDVVNQCNATASKYGYDGLTFVLGDAKKKLPKPEYLDMVVTLHACDTLTDYALEYAIENKARFIFSVPCCQHEINGQIKKNGSDFDIFMKHGLIKERFSALLTDASRISMLEDANYSVDVHEVAGFDITPKNLMIRAVRKTRGGAAPESKGKAQKLLSKYGLKQKLAELLKK